MEAKRIFDLLSIYLRDHNKADALATKENGKWVKYSTQDFIDNVQNLSYGLLALGLGKDDKIAIVANNRPEWNYADYASQQIAAVTVPIYPTISEHDLTFILKDASVKLIFVSSRDLYEKAKKCAAEIGSVKHIYTFNKVEGANHYSELLESGKKNPNEAKLDELKASVDPHSLFTILYTSGTTGVPKGVMLSHNNLLSNCYSVRNLAPFTDKWRALSFLPLNHVYERMLNTLYIYQGVSIYYAESLETIGDNLKEVKPMIFVTVPRLLEKVYEKIVSKGETLTGIKRTLFFWALDLGLNYELYGAKGWWYELKLKIARKLIFSKWQEALGGNIVCVVSGGAALNPKLERVFNAAGITLLQGYGLTETSPVIAVNSFKPEGICIGTVGTVIDGVEVKIAEDGEILSRGPHIMLGYYNRPDATAEVLDKDGWFHTGDIGTFIDNKYLKITDRKKEIFKTSGGKYIAPQMIENKIKESKYVEQVMVIGDGQKFASAFIVPNYVNVKEHFAKEGKTFKDNAELASDKEVIALIKADVEKTNKTLAQYETIKKIELLPKEWTIEKGELTPKLSLKRKVILTNNQALFEKIYKND